MAIFSSGVLWRLTVTLAGRRATPGTAGIFSVYHDRISLHDSMMSGSFAPDSWIADPLRPALLVSCTSTGPVECLLPENLLMDSCHAHASDTSISLFNLARTTRLPCALLVVVKLFNPNKQNTKHPTFFPWSCSSQHDQTCQLAMPAYLLSMSPRIHCNAERHPPSSPALVASTTLIPDSSPLTPLTSPPDQIRMHLHLLAH